MRFWPWRKKNLRIECDDSCVLLMEFPPELEKEASSLMTGLAGLYARELKIALALVPKGIEIRVLHGFTDKVHVCSLKE